MKTMKTNDSNVDKLCFDMLPCHVGNKKKAFRQIRSREWQRDSSSIVSKFKHFSQIRLQRINRFVYLFWTQPKFVDIADNLFQWISLKWLVRTKHTKIIESSSMPFYTESKYRRPIFTWIFSISFEGKIIQCREFIKTRNRSQWTAKNQSTKPSWSFTSCIGWFNATGRWIRSVAWWYLKPAKDEKLFWFIHSRQ